MLGHGLAGHGHLGGIGGHLAAAHAQSRPAYVGQLPPDYLEEGGPYGPASASYAYPYYTTRGPRDFLQNNPMGIGP
jgi:hypothetical protein